MKSKNLDDIYRSYMGGIYRYLLSICNDHYLAEDIMQETFYRAYLYLENCPDERIKPWLFRVAHNALVDFMRKNMRSTSEDGEFFAKIADPKTTEDEFLRQERMMGIDVAVNILPERQKQAILLCDFNGLSYNEAADIMDVSTGHFKVLLFRARQRMRLIKERGNLFEG